MQKTATSSRSPGHFSWFILVENSIGNQARNASCAKWYISHDSLAGQWRELENTYVHAHVDTHAFISTSTPIYLQFNLKLNFTLLALILVSPFCL